MKRTLRFGAIVIVLSCAAFAQQPADSSAHHPSPGNQPAVSANDVWAGLMAGNARFVSGKTRSHDVVALRRKLSSSQSPNAIILSCSDSRVGPELIFDQSLGDLFVVRTAGNVADPVALGSMEYAVEHLHSSLLVVLGHQKCGAVNAACSGEKMPSANLQAIVDKIDPAVALAKSHAKADDLVEAAIKENVHQSAKDVLANSAILREAVDSGKLRVVEAEYELDTGKVSRLDTPRTGN
ncbi:MAG: carbonic anhydrase [Candidatus Sulfotelmatobacter sp.]|jgi:carbonic anhydrase|nr:carbonic anhydrase [Terriglobales bacterium]